MRVPLSWLREYVDIDLPVPELAELLTNAGLEVESIETVGLPGAALEWDRERIAILKYGIDDIRQFWANDLRFLEQF